MDQFGYFERKAFFSGVYTLVFVAAEFLDLFKRHKSEKFHALFHLDVLDVSEILVEVVRRGLILVQPQSPRGGLAHLFAVALK